MSAELDVVKTYSDRVYVSSTMVRHEGTVLAFAMDDSRRIYYTVLDMSRYDPARGELDAAYWTADPIEVPFPAEIERAGFAAVGTTTMPVVKRGGRVESRPEEVLALEETDRFLSTTARLTAAAPIQVLSDSGYIVVLRQAIESTHPDMVHVLRDGGVSGDPDRTDYLIVDGTRAPIVADTLLCDRFLLVDGSLAPVAQVRFRRSRRKGQPASPTDSLGAVDMEGLTFREPTLELDFVRHLVEGRFAALLTPTAVQNQRRWQIFAHNAATARIDSFNIEQDADGLFDLQGSRYWTSPDERYRNAVYEREPGQCPFTGQELVPLVSETGHAETALAYNGTSGYVDLGSAPGICFRSADFSIEAWISPQSGGGPVAARRDADTATGFALRVAAGGQLVLEYGRTTLTSAGRLAAGVWAHVAAVYDGTTLALYIDGVVAASTPAPSAADGSAGLRIGSAVAGGFFAGTIDEVRFWNRCRARGELLDDRNHRLVGNEPGLIAYYRFDEGTGTTAYDQSDGNVRGTLVGGLTWTTSDAPVGDHPGVRRDSFTVAGRRVCSGLAATLYYQQEMAPTGYDGTAKPVKRQARVLLAFSTEDESAAGTDSTACVASIDFGVGIDGRLAEVPDMLTLPDVGRPVEETADRVSELTRTVEQLYGEVELLGPQIATLDAAYADIQRRIQGYDPELAGDLRLRTDVSDANVYHLAYMTATRWNAQQRVDVRDTGEGSMFAPVRGAPTAAEVWRLVRVPDAHASDGSAVYSIKHVQTGRTLVAADSASYGAAFAMRTLSGTPPPAAQVVIKKTTATLWKIFSALSGNQIGWSGRFYPAGTIGTCQFLVDHPADTTAAALQTQLTAAQADLDNRVRAARAADPRLVGELRLRMCPAQTTHPNYGKLATPVVWASNVQNRSTNDGAQLGFLSNTPVPQDTWRLIQIPGVTGPDGSTVYRLQHVVSGKTTVASNNAAWSALFQLQTVSGVISPSAQIIIRGAGADRWMIESALSGNRIGGNSSFYEAASGVAFAIEQVDAAAAATEYQALQDGVTAAQATVDKLRSDLEARQFPELAVLHTQLTATDGQRAQKRLALAAAQHELQSAREELARLTGCLFGTADLVLPVPRISADRTGLSCDGALLRFARTPFAPFLMDSANGRVVLYFRGFNRQFFAAYLDTAVARGAHQLTGAAATVQFTAVEPGMDMTDMRISVTDATEPGLCTLTIAQGEVTETWHCLPRRVSTAAAILAGTPADPLLLGVVAKVNTSGVELESPTLLHVPAASYIRIGKSVYVSSGDHPAGATAVTVTTTPTGPVAGDEVSLVSYDYGQAVCSQPGVALSNGSRWVAIGAAPIDVPLPNGVSTLLMAGYAARWRGDAPGRAFTFDGVAQRLSLPADRLDRVTTTGDLTVETWIKPVRAGARSRLLHVNHDNARASMGLLEASASGGIGFDSSDDRVTVTGVDLSATDFTVEFWMRRPTGKAGGDTVLSCTGAFAVAWTTNSALRFTVGGSAETLDTPASYADNAWHHWAFTCDRTARTTTIVCDGHEVARRTVTTLPSGHNPLIVGGASANQTFFTGTLAEPRIWSRARAVADIAADKDRRTAPNEADLLCAWIFTEGQLTDLTSGRRHGVLSGSPTAAGTALRGYRVFAMVGDKHRVSRETYLCGEWAHLALVYGQSWALRFDGSSWAETPDDDVLDVTGDLTLEIFGVVDALGSQQGLLTKGRLGDGTGGSCPYQLSVLPDGRLEFAFEEPGPQIVRFTSGEAITAGVFHRIAVVCTAGSSTQEVSGTKQFTYTDAAGHVTTQSVDVVEGVDAKAWDDIRFVIDGREVGVSRYTGPGPRGNDGALRIGQTLEGTALHSLRGTIGEVRIWGKSRKTDQLGQPVEPRDSGLISRWTFEENTGNVSDDRVGGHAVRLRGTRWCADPDPTASSFQLLRNGQTVPADVTAPAAPADFGDDQLTLAGCLRSGQAAELFEGTLEEVRLWRVTRTREQILDSMFTRLKGDKQDLIGYWTFDSDSTTLTADAVSDHGLRGNDLTLTADATRPAIVLSTAPVSTDTAVVRSALAGIRTTFHELIDASPAAAEYADMQYTVSGEASGVLKRCYSELLGGRWQLTTGYKVGDMVCEWVSQVQYDPQLIGFIEGAPPVPSENLTGGKPAGCAAVTFRQADQVTSSLSSAHNRSVTMALKTAVNTEFNVDVMTMVAPLGFGVAKKLIDLKFTGSVSGKMEFANSWSDETSISQGLDTHRDTSATLTGHWENPTQVLNSTVGPRFLPANHGYALVQSETADVFALRLAHSGTLVAYRMQPNPDIPKDWNIISFPINPQYTKQGTLDGAIGIDEHGKVCDPAYPMAARRGEYSYYKPREAYAIKRRILREQQQLAAYYDGVSTDTAAPDPTAERAARLLESFGGPTGNSDEQPRKPEASGSFANRNLANTYVWTADGGFFAETSGTIDVVTETIGGSYSLSGSTTVGWGFKAEFVGATAGGQFDATLAGGMTTTRHRSSEATHSTSVEVTCDPSGDLGAYDATGQPVYTATGEQQQVPGKVDAYRFMTFYLGQDTTNFDDFYNKVIDPLWLTGSHDPNAVALRQARQPGRKPPCWRILHRVTFVSRVLPPVPSADAPPLEQSMHAIDIASNYELIRRLDPYVRTAATSMARLADATTTALARQLPELIPHTIDITQLLADYYGVTD